jgi:ABC-type transport system involved in multi-copper enzyme maturation permease subunit
MTAQSISGAVAAPRPADRRLAGLGALVRKDTTEWLRGRRAWVVLAVSTLFMTLSAANSWIISRLAALVPEGGDIGELSLAPLDNLLVAVGSQMFVLAAILAVASLVVSERQAGTLAWVASKPVSRRAIWLSKWLSATGMLAVTAVLVPLAATVGVVAALYGVPDPVAVAGLAAGMVAMVAFFTAVGIAAGTVLPGVAAVAGAGIITFAVVPSLGGLLPAEIGALLPTSILPWLAGAATGAPVPVTTPIAFVAVLAAVIAFGTWRMDRLEL